MEASPKGKALKNLADQEAETAEAEAVQLGFNYLSF